MLKKVFIYGNGGHAKVVANILALTGREVSGYIDDYIDQESMTTPDGKLLIKQDLFLARYADHPVTFGFGNCDAREQIGLALLNAGVELLSVIHPSAAIGSEVELGRGCCIGAGVVIDPNCRIGDFVIVNNRACICHDSDIGPAVHLAPGVNLAGAVRVGPRSWIGIGSSVKEQITIGADVIVGAGSVVIRDIANGVKCFGNPAHKNTCALQPEIFYK